MGLRRITLKIVRLLPQRVQAEMMRYYYLFQASRDSFVSPEPEFTELQKWVRSGSFVIDVGANVGHYTRRMSELAGSNGNVLALEPVPRTFALLTANVAGWGRANVILLNAAASSKCGLLPMNVPEENGLPNYYQSAISTTSGPSAQRVLAVRLDDVLPQARVSLIKIDAEGHELQVLEGLRGTIERDRPALIIEGDDQHVRRFLESFGYAIERNPRSPNLTATVSVSSAQG